MRVLGDCLMKLREGTAGDGGAFDNGDTRNKRPVVVDLVIVRLETIRLQISVTTPRDLTV